MAAGKTDHRVKVTKQLIRESLARLMREYHISRISVKMLCDAAGINRSTFYAHYTDTLDLLSQIQAEAISELSTYISESAFSEQSPLTVQALQRILDYARENSELFKALLSDNGDYAFQRNIMLLAQQKIVGELRNMRSVTDRTSEYLQLFVVTGALSVIQKWLSDDMPESTQEMAVFCYKLLYTGLSGFNFN